MPSYSIIITRDITESCFTHVEADSEAEAREAAMEWLAECDDPGWRVDDGSCGTSPAYITDCTEESNPMTTATQHEADQAAITAACEAGVCDHPECNRTPCEVAQAIMDETDADQDNNRRRAARIALAILPAYDDDTADQGIRDAVTDLLHLCDLVGLDFADLVADARGNYLRELQDLGPASGADLRRAIERN